MKVHFDELDTPEGRIPVLKVWNENDHVWRVFTLTELVAPVWLPQELSEASIG